MASRLENSARNVLVALGGQAFSIILAFVTRGIFARQLSLEYMGLENLFSNVLTILSLADLGVASAIIFALYRPLAEENHEQVRAIMRLFRNVYVIIGLVIIAAGLVLTPYIDVLIKDTPDIPYLKLYFFMFVANTGISYFFSYKGCLIAADQKKYIVSLNQYAFQIVMCIAQITVLFVTHNYFLFLCCMVGSTLLQNISISIIANRMYPYILKGKGKPKVDPETIDQIKKNTFAMVLHRVAGVANTPASSLILSSFVGIHAIALYGNYMLVVNSMTRVVDQIFDAVVAPLGNLGVTGIGRAPVSGVQDMLLRERFYRGVHFDSHVVPFQSRYYANLAWSRLRFPRNRRGADCAFVLFEGNALRRPLVYERVWPVLVYAMEGGCRDGRHALVVASARFEV